jgi:hypothetical protein
LYHNISAVRNGGDTRIRTGDNDFADHCLTTWRCRLKRIFHSIKKYVVLLSKADKKMERETRLELATSTLARLRSTTELFPLIMSIAKSKKGFLLSNYFFCLLENISAVNLYTSVSGFFQLFLFNPAFKQVCSKKILLSHLHSVAT